MTHSTTSSNSTAGTTAKIGLITATTIVIANMVGTGVFTSLGFQIMGIDRPLTLLLLWAIGGILALCGGFAYGELGSAMPRSGGEYHYLSKLYHPSIGFLSGWVSATVGFAAPVALASMAFGQYFHGSLPLLSPKLLATILIVGISLIHLARLNVGGQFQNIVTIIKVGLILTFIFCGLFLIPKSVPLDLMPTSADFKLLLSPAFAISLVYVSYAYSGWNGSTYLASEVRNPASTVPKSILIGTVIVIVLYLLLNYVFLYSTPMADLSGKLEVGLISANNIFGVTGGKIMGVLISLCLISTISAMVMAGPRVLKVLGEDYPKLALFSKQSRTGIPWIAILTQSSIALILLWTSTFEKVLTYVGVTLALFTTLSVFGVFILRRRKEASPPYRTTGFPITVVLFLALNIWMLVFLCKGRPAESIAGLGTLVLGYLVYLAVRKKSIP